MKVISNIEIGYSSLCLAYRELDTDDPFRQRLSEAMDILLDVVVDISKEVK